MKMTTTMKKWWQMTLCALMLLTVAACGKDEDDGIIWDIANFKIEIQVYNSDGQNMTGQVATLAPKAVWREKTYELNKDLKDVNLPARTRALAVVFQGLYTENGRLYFGEFQGSSTYDKEPLVIEWADGTTNKIEFSHELIWKDNEPLFNQQFWLDGKSTKYPIIITK